MYVMLLRLVFGLITCTVTNAQQHFGERSVSCVGGSSDSFEQQIQAGARLLVGDFPPGLIGLEIRLRCSSDVDIQLDSGSIEVVNWAGSIITESSQVTKTWENNSITYSGYNGDGTGLGNEFLRFNDVTRNAFQIYAYGYVAGSATVDYSWTGQANCTGGGDNPSGTGTFSQRVTEGTVTTVGEIPGGATDVYIRLDSTVDVDIQLTDGVIAVINRDGGVINGSSFQSGTHNGLQLQYSGYNGEQRPDASGQEYIFIQGTVPRNLTLSVAGYATGIANINYSWGYYSNATSLDGSILKSQLHNIISGHTKLSYTPGVWDAIKRADQDIHNPDNVVMIYSRRSEPKDDQDTGESGEGVWNREHIYAKSHGDFGTTPGPGTDIHALRAAETVVNAERSNKDFAYGGTQLSSSQARDDCPLCLETDESFEPPDEVKGDVARMIFYMAVRYDGDSDSNGVTLNVVDGVGTSDGSSTANNGEIGDLASLKAWHTQDPVSDEEKHRNNIIHDIQGNRNPFIDNPHFVDIIF